VSRRFDYDIADSFAWITRLAGLHPDRDGVELTDDGRFVATYGRLRVDVPLEQIDSAHVTGPYRWWTAVGTRLSLADDGLTFGTSTGPGACIHFDPPLDRVLLRRHHSALTVTVEDPQALVAALSADK
jgi:hypothetical protein